MRRSRSSEVQIDEVLREHSVVLGYVSQAVTSLPRLVRTHFLVHVQR